MTMLVGCYYAADKPLIEGSIPKANSTIGEFQRLVGGGADYIEDDIILCGRVTSCDNAQNFYRSLMVEDATGGVEVMVGYYDLCSIYPEGLEVALTVKGCAAGVSHGIVQIGSQAPSYNPYPIDYLDARSAVDKVIHRSLSVEPVVPMSVTVADLEQRHCGRLVTIDSLRLVLSTSIDTMNNCVEEARWRGTALFADSHDHNIAVYTRDYARYADSVIPDSLLSLTGIVQRGTFNGEDVYYIKMRYESDAVAY